MRWLQTLWQRLNLVERLPNPRSGTASAGDRFRRAVSDPGCEEIFRTVQPHTMTSYERVAGLCLAVDYLVRARVEGAFVECGVWRGGSCMAAMLRLQERSAPERDFWLFDTFDGMPPPGDADLNYRGERADDLMASADPATSNIWARCAKEVVRRNLTSTGYDIERVRLVEGCVEDTLLNHRPEQIALLRLDTDWYESTRVELQQLFPRLAVGGVLIIDDYGHWQGARRAMDEYIEENGLRLFLAPIDYTGRIAIKQA